MLLEHCEEFVVVVLVESFQLRRLERLGQLLEVLFVKEPEHPLEQDELLVEFQRGRFGK